MASAKGWSPRPRASRRCTNCCRFCSMRSVIPHRDDGDSLARGAVRGRRVDAVAEGQTGAVQPDHLEDETGCTREEKRYEGHTSPRYPPPPQYFTSCS